MRFLSRGASLILLSTAFLGAGLANKAHAQTPTPPEQPKAKKAKKSATSPAVHQRAYCEWVQAEAGAEQSLLWAPEVVAWSWGRGMYQDFPLGASDSFRGHLLVGFRYDFSALYRAWLHGDQADIGCRRYIAKTRFDAALSRAKHKGKRQALQAKLALLEEAIPHAQKVVDGLKRAVTGKRASDRDLRAMQFRLDALERLAQQTRYSLDELGKSSAPPKSDESLRALMEAYLQADAEYERARARLRQSQAWHVSIAAGYSHDFGWERQAPVFAGGQFSFDLGRLWQGAQVDRAIEAHEDWQRTRPGGLGGEYQQLLRATVSSERAVTEQLRANGAILADLEARLERLEPLNSQEAVSYRNLVWFDYAELLAETAAAAQRLKAARGFLQAEGAPTERAQADEQADEIATLLGQKFALNYEPKPLPQIKRPPTPLEVLEALKPVDPRDFYIVLGDVTLKEDDKKTFDIESPKTRFYFPGSDGRSGRIRFTFGGNSENITEFASGKTRSQIGLKLRAKDSCNLLYVMWRIDPEQRIVVSKKVNPGKNIHAKCGNDGYQNLVPTSVTHPPLVKPGETHTFGAVLDKGVLHVFVDKKLIWKGEVGDLGFDGPTGLRSDNGLFRDVTIFTAERK